LAPEHVMLILSLYVNRKNLQVNVCCRVQLAQQQLLQQRQRQYRQRQQPVNQQPILIRLTAHPVQLQQAQLTA